MDYSNDPKGSSADSYHAVISADGKVAYDGEAAKGNGSLRVFFQKDAKNLAISFARKIEGHLQPACAVSIDLQEQGLFCSDDDVTGSRKFQITYKVDVETTLQAFVNDREATQTISGEGTTDINLEEGQNNIAVYMQTENVTYVIQKSVYYDAIAPDLTFDESIDQMIVSGSEFTILGKVAGARTLTVNGEEITVQDNGNFSYTAKLPEKENAFTFKATDANGNATQQTITLFREGDAMTDITEESGSAWHLPMLATFLFGVFMIGLCVAFVYKSTKKRH